MSESIFKSKSCQFAISIVKAPNTLVSEEKAYVLSNQLLISGAAIGALIMEAKETFYWQDVLKDTDNVNIENRKSLFGDCRQLVAMLVSTIKTAKSKL